jgi:hypothetical protein
VLQVGDGDTVTVHYLEAEDRSGAPRRREFRTTWQALTRPPDFREIGLSDRPGAQPPCAGAGRGARRLGGPRLDAADPAEPLLVGEADADGRFLLTAEGDLPETVHLTAQEPGLPESGPSDEVDRSRVAGRVVVPGTDLGVLSALVETRAVGAPDPCAGIESCSAGGGLTDHDGWLARPGTGQAGFSGEAGDYDLYVDPQGVPEAARYDAGAYGSSGPFRITLPEGRDTVDAGVLPLAPPLLVGSTREPDGAPVVQAQADVFYRDGQLVTNTYSDPDGGFALHVRDGSYRVRVRGPIGCREYDEQWFDLEVREGTARPSTLDVVLKPRPANSYRWRMPVEAPPAVGVAVRLDGPGVEVVLRGTDRTGTLTIACSAADWGDRRVLDDPVDIGFDVSFGEATVCLRYEPGRLAAEGVAEEDLELLHKQDDGSVVPITSVRDLEQDRVCGETSSFSPFSIGAPGQPDAEPEPQPSRVPAVRRARAVDDACPDGRVPEDGFTDVAPGTAHEASVDCVVWWGVARGRTPSTYAPGESVTRAQMATFLANLLDRSGDRLPAAGRDWFSDDDGSVHEASINRLAEAGVVRGRADGGYGPALPVTRDAMATFLVRATERRTGQPLTASRDWFADDDGNTHEPAIDRAATAGLTGGTASGGYAPGVPVKREQMASFLARVLDLLVEQRHAAPPPERSPDARRPRPSRGRGRRTSSDAQAVGTDATPGARKRLPVTSSDTPARSRYGVMPPRWNGHPAPSSMHRSMSCASPTTPSSSIRPISSAAARSAASRTCSVGLGRGARRRLVHRDDLGVDGEVGAVDRGLARLDDLAQVVRDVEPVGERLVQRLRHVQRDGRPDQREQHQRAHRQPEGLERGVGLLERRALVDRPGHLAEEAGEQPVDDERRGVLDQHARLLQRLAGGEGGRERRVVGALGAHDLEQRQDRDGVEEVEADDPLGVLEVGGHVGDRQRRGVGGEHALRCHDGLDLGEHLLLHLEVLEHRLDDEVGVGERVLGQRARDHALQPVGLVGAEPAALQQLVDLAVGVVHALVEAGLVEVGHDDRHLEPLREQQRHLRGHQPGADDADLGDRAGQRPVGGAEGTLGALLHEVEGVEAGAQLLAEDEVGQRLVLGRPCLLERRRLGQREQVQRAVGRGRGALDLGVDEPAGTGDGVLPGLAALDLGPLDDDVAVRRRTPPRPATSPGSRRARSRRRRCPGRGLRPLEHLVVRQGVLEHDLGGLLGADEVRQQLRAAPARDQAQEALGQGDSGHAGRHGPVVAVQRDLQAAAHGRAVDERERRDSGLLEPGEDAVAEPARLERDAAVGHEADALEVGADGEDERLAGDGDGGHPRAARLDLVERGVDVGQALRPEGRRLGVVEAVVERQQRDLAHPVEVEVADRCAGDDLVEALGGAHVVLPSTVVGAPPRRRRGSPR